MKYIYYIKEIDILLVIYLYFFVLRNNSEINYIKCTRKSKFIINVISKYTSKKFKQFIKRNIITNDGSTLHITHNETNKLALKYVEEVMKKNSFMDFFSTQLSKKFLHTFIRHSISIDIYDIIYFKIFLLNHKKKKIENCTIITNNYFINNDLKNDIETSNISLKFFPIIKNNIILRILKFLIDSFTNFLNSFIVKIVNIGKIINKNTNKKIAINYTFDLSSVNSNSWWLDELAIPKKNIIYYFSNTGSKVKASDKIIETILKKGYSVNILDKNLNNTNKNKINNENIFISTKDNFLILKSFFVIFLQYKNFYLFKWNLHNWLKLIYKIQHFRLYLIQNNINVIVDHSETNLDLVSLAAQLVGAKKIGFQRSEIIIPRSKIVRLNNYHFVWGNLAHHVSNVSINKFTQFIRVGHITHSSINKKKKKNPTKKLILDKKDNKNKIIVSIFDRSSGFMNDHNINDHIVFYSKILNFCENNKDIVLLIKPKNKIRYDILSENNIEKKINKLTKEKKLFLFDHSLDIYDASLRSDFSISMGLNGTGTAGALEGTFPFYWDILSHNLGPYKNLYDYGEYNNYNVSDNLDKIIKIIEKKIISKEVITNLKISKSFLNMRNYFDDCYAHNRIAIFVSSILNNNILTK